GLFFVLGGEIGEGVLEVGGGGDAESLGARRGGEEGRAEKKKNHRPPRKIIRDAKTAPQTAAATKASWIAIHLAHRGQTRRIMTSVDLTSAATRSPGLRRISLAASAVMMEVMCCSPMARVICARRPLYLMAVTRPMSWLRPLIFRKLPRREEGSPRLRDAGMRRSISDSGTRWWPPGVF